MKIFGIIAGCLAGASAQGLGQLRKTISSEFSSYESSTITVNANYLTELDEFVKSDIKSHGAMTGQTRTSLMPSGGQCGLHWSLCPNMCNLMDTLDNNFADIIGNKMEQYQVWKAQIETKKRLITEDLVGKLDQVQGLEDDLERTGHDLETQQALFLNVITDHLERANAIKESLLRIQEDFTDIGEDLTRLSDTVQDAHTDCYEQAPCMAVPTCKLGVASGKSCADIAQNALDLDEQGEQTLNMESAVHIIQPDGLEPKAAICEFDYTGTGFTVVQNRHNNTGRFTGDFENGFGTTVGYDDAACDTANYYLGNKYIRAITDNKSALRVKHDGSIAQWNQVSMDRNSYNLRNGGHVCGDDDTLVASDITLGSGGINGQWNGQTQVMIGVDKSPDMDPDCIEDHYYDYNSTTSGKPDYDGY